MAIKKFIPGPKKIIDHRGNPHGFYEAVCDVCGTEYYPKRSNSKYCNSKCAVVAHRTAIANGTKTKKKVTPPEPVSKPKKSKEFRGATAVYKYLKEIYDTRGEKTYILNELKELSVDDVFVYGTLYIKRVSPQKYEI